LIRAGAIAPGRVDTHWEIAAFAGAYTPSCRVMGGFHHAVASFRSGMLDVRAA
jgi:hypothetical protein